MARLPPLGYSTFYLQPGTGSRGDSGDSSCVSAFEPQQRGTVGSSSKGDRFVTLDNGLVSLEFDTQTGMRVRWVIYSCCGSKSAAMGMHLPAIDLRSCHLFIPAPGLLSSMTANGATARISTSFAWYNSSDGLDVGEERNRGQASGAYIFRCAGLAAGAYANMRLAACVCFGGGPRCESGAAAASIAQQI